MSTEPNITQDELKKEIEKGKSMKEIAYDYGYGHPSRTLADKIRDLGYRKNNKLSFYDYGGANFSIGASTLDSMFEDQDFSREDNLFYRATDKGNKLVIEITDRQWTKQEGDTGE